jgi:hypothetical protein
MTASGRRSITPIELADLHRLATIAAEVEAEARGATPAARSAVLCARGAAVHHVDLKNGIKDFDVSSLYAARPDGSFPATWRGTAAQNLPICAWHYSLMRWRLGYNADG